MFGKELAKKPVGKASRLKQLQSSIHACMQFIKYNSHFSEKSGVC